MISRSRVLASAALATALAPLRLGAQALQSLRMAGVPTDDSTPVFYGIKNGLYAKAGIDMQWVPISSGTAATTAVLTGTYELGKASPMAPVLAHLKGVPVAIFAHGAVSRVRTPYSAMIVAVDSPIKTGADCNGKTGASPGLTDINSLAMMRWIDRNGGDASTVKWVEVPGSAVAEAVGDHRIDFATLQEPQLTAAVETGKVRALADVYAAVADGWLTAAYIVQPAFADAHADVLRRWIRVTYEAAAYTNPRKAETAPLMSEITKIPLPVYLKMKRTDDATSTDPGVLQPVIDLAVRYKAISRSFPAKEMYWFPA